MRSIVFLCVAVFVASPFTLHPTPDTQHPTPIRAQGVQKGKASFYSRRATGSRTANGERLHHDSLTCAHRTYPFGTLLKVSNPANGQSVIVRVTDRGPFVRGRIIDLSWRAAKELGILQQGIAQVIVERYSTSIVPFKPEDTIDIPELDLGINDNTDNVKPVWVMLKEERDRKKAEEEAEAKRAAEAKKAAEAKRAEEKRHQEEESKRQEEASRKTDASIQDDGLDAINKKPNTSKAYQKRQQR